MIIVPLDLPPRGAVFSAGGFEVTLQHVERLVHGPLGFEAEVVRPDGQAFLCQVFPGLAVANNVYLSYNYGTVHGLLRATSVAGVMTKFAAFLRDFEQTAEAGNFAVPTDGKFQDDLPILSNTHNYVLPDIRSTLAVECVSGGEPAVTRRDVAAVVSGLGFPGTVMPGMLVGPSVTTFYVEVAANARRSRLEGFLLDLALRLGVPHVRLTDVGGGPQGQLGLEVPNAVRATVTLGGTLVGDEHPPGRQLAFVVGLDRRNVPVYCELARAPHVLIAGTTGSGKSVAVNALLGSLLCQYSPNDLRLVLIDPKMLELAVYDTLPHLARPVASEPEAAQAALGGAVAEMQRRYRLMKGARVRDFDSFNARLRKNGDRAPWPRIVVVIDEFAELAMMAGKRFMRDVARLAQMARAAGIHLVLATQRPTANIVDGTIKANVPVRIVCRTLSRVDSMVALDQAGAEHLLGNGDMLYANGRNLERVQGCLITTSEVEDLVNFWGQQPAQPSLWTLEDEQ